MQVPLIQKAPDSLSIGESLSISLFIYFTPKSPKFSRIHRRSRLTYKLSTPERAKIDPNVSPRVGHIFKISQGSSFYILGTLAQINVLAS